MCGICGSMNLADQANPPDPTVLEAMKGQFVHRGPDGEGSALLERAALGMRRLTSAATSPAMERCA
jgi:asparagine synthetase B (glutamine-hydrolysing)